MPFRTVVHGGEIVTDTDQFHADIVIDDGIIVAIVANAANLSANQRIDASQLLVLPGAIDTRTTFHEPDPEGLEGILRGGLAAAAGGVTTVIDLPVSSATSSTTSSATSSGTSGGAAESAPTAEDTAARIREIGRSTIVDIALWAAPSGDGRAMSRIARLGVAGFASSMDPDASKLAATDDAGILLAMIALADLNVPLSIHCESPSLVAAGVAAMRAAGRRDALAAAESRPPIVESVAVNTALFLAEQTGCWIHIPHVSAAESLRLIADARTRHVRVTTDTCPHYLTLNQAELERLGGFGRTAPALRDQDEIDQLWSFVLDETIDAISSDHIAATIEAKAAGDHDIFAAPIGLPGVQTMLPVFWDEAVNKRGMSRSQFARQTATNAAQIFGLYPRKGSIRIGADADLVLFDPEGSWEVHGSELLYSQGWSPFEGRAVKGMVVRTIRRGETIYDAERHADTSLARPGSGRFLPRTYGASQPA
ncbi:MAG: amidohydrolase family protein [Chloroflexia bacterium]|nr:amidohydrolase family protein [Chloroflexia bacterium]